MPQNEIKEALDQFCQLLSSAQVQQFVYHVYGICDISVVMQ